MVYWRFHITTKRGRDMGEHDHHLGISIQNYLWFSLETMMSFFEHICCLIVLINHTILYIKSKCSIEYFLVFFKLTFKCYPCVSRLSTNSILNLWGAGQRLGQGQFVNIRIVGFDFTTLYVYRGQDPPHHNERIFAISAKIYMNQVESLMSHDQESLSLEIKIYQQVN